MSRNIRRYLNTSNINCAKVRIKGASSNDWISRQIADPYVEKAKMLNYRCRSAFKLLEIDERFKFFQPGQLVIDCGASPGSWTQVVVDKINSHGKNTKLPKGMVISIDRQPIYPIEGATILGNHDFTALTTQNKIKELLQQRMPDVVLSDIAPNASGVADLDHEAMIALAYSVLRFAVQVTSPNGILLTKLWSCGSYDTLKADISRFYRRVKTVKPNASRSDSAEIFILARDFKGLQK